ncbi:hypothetical protein A8B82_22875 [Sulfitobacter sp. EhC04]|uniref:DUF1403 family protein n=1 Tax=Sulfitobacter sp. EhC04 TaxID=1849168 RepID=UPI0007F3D8A8|nr:DUF1403 family protein [Sulfitobacter sp. EhC04]OAN69128.1 hypothetical protein A8B82_22875 [Sulfitobacter sp. EhC04]
MTYQRTTLSGDQNSLPKLPAWVTSQSGETLETVAFRSGVALTILDQLVSDPSRGVPVKLLANRLALTAASATSKLEGRLAREVDIRDAYHLTPPGEMRGPDGELLTFWREASWLRLSGKDWQAALEELIGSDLEVEVDGWLKTAEGRVQSNGPLAGCVFAMCSVLQADDRAERFACLLADVVLARCLNWQTVLPVSAQHLTKAMLRGLVAEGQGADLKVQTSLLTSIEDTIRLATNLAQRAAAIRAVAPKLRAKGSDSAVALFLSEDAVAPSTMLSPMIQGTTIPMTDRAARRLCDRLVELGVARELTGRPTFRLYGIAQ